MEADNHDATYEIWTELKSNLHRFIARRSKNEADADDILQDVFFKIHSAIHRLRETTKLHSWVYQITRNTIIDYYRSQRKELSLDGQPDAFDVAMDEPNAADSAREEILACLGPMVARLPKDYREALHMSDVMGITQANVAGELNLSVSGAKSRVQRARGKMKRMLLDCCHFEFDQRGRAVDMNPRGCGSSCGTTKC